MRTGMSQPLKEPGQGTRPGSVMLPRCVSLLPGATQMIYDMGLESALHGVSCYCPPKVQAQHSILLRDSKPKGKRSGSGMMQCGQLWLDVDALLRARPEVIFTQQTCSVCLPDAHEMAQLLNRIGYSANLVSIDPTRLEDVYQAANLIATALGQDERSQGYVKSLRSKVQALVTMREQQACSLQEVAFLEWVDPFFHAGHWIADQIELAGGQDSLARAGKKSEVVPWERLMAYDPACLLIAPCGYSIEQTRVAAESLWQNPNWVQLKAVRSGRVFALDANLYTQPSASTLVEGIALLAHVLHPLVFPWQEPWQSACLRLTRPTTR
jgi:iron complex transport system substrate-binding protein